MPVITDNDSWDEMMRPASPLNVWGRILLDLRDAISLLDATSSVPTWASSDGRVGKYAAEAMLARAFLFYTGFYQGHHDIAREDASVKLPDGSTLTKADVVAYLEDCVFNSRFALVGDFRNLWPYTNRLTVEDNPYTAGQGLKWVEDDGGVNVESLFKIKYDSYGSWNTYVRCNLFALYMGDPIQSLYVDGNFPIGVGWGAAPVSPSFYDDWTEAEPEDMRRDASVQIKEHRFVEWYVNQETFLHEKKTSPVRCKTEEEGNYGGYHLFETIMFGSDDHFQTGSIHPLNIIRYADVLLMHSELTGTVTGINRVRSRAGMKPIDTYSLAALQQERRWELAFEGVRWNDMRRWGDDYCVAALNKQEGVLIYSNGEMTGNYPIYLDGDSRGYGERYLENHGFIDAPWNYDAEGGMALLKMQGDWTLDDTFTAGCYGTLKYGQATASAFLANPSANGLVKGYHLSEMRQQMDGYVPGELSPLAYMTIEGDQLSKYNANDECLAKGSVSVTLTDNYDMRICSLTITGDALPYAKTADGAVAQTFDLVALDDDRLILVDNSRVEKGSEAAYWVFRRTKWVDISARDLGGRKWAMATYSGRQGGALGPYGLAASNSLYSMNCVASTFCRDMDSFFSQHGVSACSREIDPFAYMEFDLNDMKVKKYDRDGQLLHEGTFEVELTNDANGFFIRISDNATFIPYLYGTAEKVQRLRFYFEDERLVLWSEKADTEGAYTYWLLGDRGLTDSEFDASLRLQQEDKDGNVVENGEYLRVSVEDGSGVDRKVKCESLDGTVVKDLGNNRFKLLVQWGSAKAVPMCFTLVNSGEQNAVSYRTVSVSPTELSRETAMLAGLSGSKTWRWDTSVNGTCWGNMGYLGDAGSDVGKNGNGQWWGVSSNEEFNGQLQHSAGGVAHGDGDLDASMVFTDNGIVTCYDKYGQVIRTGTFSVENFDDSDPAAWKVGDLRTDAILWPWVINTGAKMPSECGWGTGAYEIVYLAADKMTLVYPCESAYKDGLGSWGEATYWHFKSNSDIEAMAVGYDKGKAWTWDTSVSGTCWGSMGYCGGDGSLVGTEGYGQWWGVTGEADFLEHLDLTKDGRAHGDESKDAYMYLSSDGIIRRVAGNGRVIKEGTYDFIPSTIYSSIEQVWKLADLVTTPGTILWPYEASSGEIVPRFEVVYLTSDKMTLVYPDGGGASIGNWAAATYWHFKAR